MSYVYLTLKALDVQLDNDSGGCDGVEDIHESDATDPLGQGPACQQLELL